MATANQEYFDAALRHHIHVRRWATGEVRRALELLEDVDRDVVRRLRRGLPNVGSWQTKRFNALLERIRDMRGAAIAELHRRTRDDLKEFAGIEASLESRILGAAIPIEIDLLGVPAAKLRKIVTAEPLRGRHLRTWFADLAREDRRRVEDALRIGMVEGESVPAMVRRIAGTRAQNFRDGVLSITRRNAETVVRTAVNHTSNRAREEMWTANEDVILGYRWTSTLDGRTSAICRARDGHVAPVEGKPIPEDFILLQPPGARPPAHPNCRSIMVAILDPDGVVGERPFVVDTRTRARREVDFRRMARETGRPIREIRSEWAAEAVGRVPAKTTYNQWLRRQSAAFQDDVLGRTKGRLFRRGELEMDAFVDRSGRELTLAELADSRPEAFLLAGLDPAEF
jgi:SPP1 gp7 family putative phage head morphogenesis protein